jgi:hypothetical protein
MNGWLDIFTLIAAAATSIGTAITAVGVIVAGWQIRESRRLSRTEFEDGLTHQYREIIKGLPVKALLGDRLTPEELDASLHTFYAYIDLTNDQIFLRQQQRVCAETWENWRDGIRSFMTMPAFEEAWQKIKERPATKFDELRALERSGYQGDSYLWNKEVTQSGLALRQSEVSRSASVGTRTQVLPDQIGGDN